MTYKFLANRLHLHLFQINNFFLHSNSKNLCTNYLQKQNLQYLHLFMRNCKQMKNSYLFLSKVYTNIRNYTNINRQNNLLKSSTYTTHIQLNNIHTSLKMVTEVTFEQMQEFQNNPSVLIIDVRTFEEVQSTGQIGGSINIPIDALEESLKTFKDANFSKKYGRTIPDENFPLIFSCKLGGRAAKGADIAKNLGFKDARIYKGSWTEWEEKTKNV